MPMYDDYRQQALQQLQLDAQRNADQHTAQYQQWMAELSAESAQMRAYGYDDGHQVAAQREHLYAVYAERIAQVQAELDAQVQATNREFDAKETDYSRGAGRFGQQPSAPSTHIRDFGEIADDEIAEVDESWASRFAAWFG